MANENERMNFTTAQMDSLFDGSASLFEKGAKTINRIADSINSVDFSSRRNTAPNPFMNNNGYNPNQYGYGYNNPNVNPQPVQYGYGYGTTSTYSGFGFGNLQMGTSSVYDHPFDGFWNPAYGMSMNGGY